jgi:hypothetical protein
VKIIFFVLKFGIKIIVRFDDSHDIGRTQQLKLSAVISTLAGQELSLFSVVSRAVWEFICPSTQWCWRLFLQG